MKRLGGKIAYVYFCFFFHFSGKGNLSFLLPTIQELEEMKKELEEAKMISIPEPKDERQTSRF